MIGTIALAVIMYVDASGRPGGMLVALQATPDFKDGMLDMIPNLSVWNISSMLFMVYAGFLWILSFPTGGFYVQRLLSTKNESEATKAFLWYNFAHFVLRSWPWIVVGMLSMIYFPNVSNPENSYAESISRFLPVGLKGLMVASFLAAYMSTISTHLNWGTSYIVHDLYEGFINPNASRKNVLIISRICMVTFTILAAIIATKLQAMITAYQFLTQIWAGMGIILVARWYWWRVTAGTEFICLITTLALTILLNMKTGPDGSEVLLCDGLFSSIQSMMHFNYLDDGMLGWLHFAIRIFILTFLPAILSIIYCFVRNKKPTEAAIEFYKKMRIASVGWKIVEEMTGLPSPKGEFKMNFIGWIVTSFALFGILLGIGSLIFQQWGQALCYLPIGVIASYFTWKIMSGSTFSNIAEEDQPH